MLLRSLIIIILLAPAPAWPVDWYTATVTERKPQSRELFVQGLEILDDQLYVSTGNYGESRLLRYHFEDGSLDVSRKLASNLFGEGLTVLGNKIYQLTWREGQMLIYRKSDLAFLESKPLPGEGWGLTNNGEQLVYSDGSAILRFLEPSDAKVKRSIRVTLHGRPVRFLNELEWIDGSIWANVWRSNEIIIIEPGSGVVTGVIDLKGLLPAEERRAGTDVLNGIARNPKDGGIWVTGKRWPWLYRINLEPRKASPNNP
ncbi:glutaminyl-peptide cyclotransferase [Halieaceae bacterium IMCC11814]|uniref:Glutaminyl-peptide cyclotransferase n=1 Tax=Candidatus Marimicrobium litorale TaxID=2518991 RepID=A0ABT3T380_9GAMM|nr:glutaminyl-peptide cyclotransferase [Candidatus Marimicrobium litorale]